MKGVQILTRRIRGFGTAVTLSLMGLLLACGAEAPSGPTVAGRWYTVEQVEQGQTLFLGHCATCHGESAEGTVDWRKTDENGNYPPPPLNGSAHAWHHPTSVLERTIEIGGAPNGGVMPGFGSILKRDEARATIAYFQSFWSDDIYAGWEEIDRR